MTKKPDILLKKITDSMEDGTISTWVQSSSGAFTHTTKTDQWKNKAWLRPSVSDGMLIFNIIRPKGGNISQGVYAVYHGRFAEMLLAHFDTDLDLIQMTALAGGGDLV